MTYTITRQQIADAALKLRGVKFRHQGRDVTTGVDCVGLLHAMLVSVSYPHIVDAEAYKRTPPASLIRETLQANFDEIAVEDCGLGDILLMRVGGVKPRHAGIIVNMERDVEKGIVPQLIHTRAMANNGVAVVEPIRQWFKLCVHGYRLRGLID